MRHEINVGSTNRRNVTHHLLNFTFGRRRTVVDRRTNAGYATQARIGQEYAIPSEPVNPGTRFHMDRT